MSDDVLARNGDSVLTVQQVGINAPHWDSDGVLRVEGCVIGGPYRAVGAVPPLEAYGMNLGRDSCVELATQRMLAMLVDCYDG